MQPTPESIAAVDGAITSRRAVRAFLPTPVAREMVEDILRVASRAPSGANTQPWKVYVLLGGAKSALTAGIMRVFGDPAALAQHSEEFMYYPTEWVPPFIDRRRKIGWDMYRLLGIGKGDKAEMHAQFGRNFVFFGAPVGLMFTIDRIMRQGSWLDYGMFVQSVMVAARARGLHTCPQAAFLRFHRIVMDHIGAPPNEMLVCGMSMGVEEPSEIVNSLVTERTPVADFAKFIE